MKLERLREAHPEAGSVEMWAEDEARLGLKPVVRRVWAPGGERPVAKAKRGYKWTYLYGFVHPESGKVFWMILPTVTTWGCSRWPWASSPGRWERAKTSA